MAIFSMTGFGKGSGSAGAFQVTVELASVNRKQLEVRFSLPRELAAAEADIRKILNTGISRGMINCRVTVTGLGGSSASALGIHMEKFEAFAGFCREMTDKYQLKKEFSAVDLLQLPGVFDSDMEQDSPELHEALTMAVKAALADFNSMRLREGAALREELRNRLALLRELIEQIRPYAGKVEANLKEKLLAKLSDSDLNVDIYDERLLKEILYYTDKADVTEELTRLESHFQQFDGFLDGGAGVGRSMDFLLQEMFREITTLGNKAGAMEISPLAVKFKSELEKIREQVQNIE